MLGRKTGFDLDRNNGPEQLAARWEVHVFQTLKAIRAKQHHIKDN